MTRSPVREPQDISGILKWTILSRVLFALVLIVSCIVFSSGENLSFFSLPFLYLYNIAAFILLLSVVYIIWLNFFSRHILLGYAVTVIDTFIISSIVFVTGGYNSFFTFLYLLVIIYASILLLQKGSLLVAVLSSIQYGILIELEYYALIRPPTGHIPLAGAVDESHIIYRIIVIIMACFGVAVLSGILAHQLKGAKQELKIVQEHLKRAEKMAAMDEMISGIAHEIKNPLASLSGSIQLLQEDRPPGSYEDKLMQIILRETERLKNIINDIRLFAKPNTQNAVPVKIAEKIRETVELFLKDPKWKNLSIQMKLDEALEVSIDPTHLSQILWNLLKNAADATQGNGSIIIELKAYRNTKVYLAVEDNGSGIEKEKKHHIFDPFFTTKPDGTGLGLSIIHRIIDTYQGMIDVETKPGFGTVFTILFQRLPMREKSKS